MDTEWKILKISTFNKIMALLKMAHYTKAMYGLILSPGCGKTLTINQYMKNVNNCIYFKIDKVYDAKSFYIELLKLVNVHDYDRRVELSVLAKKFAFVLNQRKERTLLVLDEAGKFTAPMAEHFQSIRDSTQSHVGIVLAGPEKFYKDFSVWVKRKHRGIPELESRITDWIFIDPPTDSEKYQIIKANGIEDPKEIKAILKKSTDLRKLYQFVTEYHYLKSIKNEEQQS